MDAAAAAVLGNAALGDTEFADADLDVVPRDPAGRPGRGAWTGQRRGRRRPLASGAAAPGRRPAPGPRLRRRRCRKWRTPWWDATGTLITSELVTNAVRHAGTRVVLRLDRRPDGLVIAVDDEADGLPRIVPAEERVSGGRGLAIVEELSAEWGVPTRPGARRCGRGSRRWPPARRDDEDDEDNGEARPDRSAAVPTRPWCSSCHGARTWSSSPGRPRPTSGPAPGSPCGRSRICGWPWTRPATFYLAGGGLRQTAKQPRSPGRSPTSSAASPSRPAPWSSRSAPAGRTAGRRRRRLRVEPAGGAGRRGRVDAREPDVRGAGAEAGGAVNLGPDRDGEGVESDVPPADRPPQPGRTARRSPDRPARRGRAVGPDPPPAGPDRPGGRRGHGPLRRRLGRGAGAAGRDRAPLRPHAGRGGRGRGRRGRRDRPRRRSRPGAGRGRRGRRLRPEVAGLAGRTAPTSWPTSWSARPWPGPGRPRRRWR